MKKYQIKYTDQAINDLEELYDYLASELSREVANKTRLRIMEEISTLSSMPERMAPYQKEPWYSHGWRKLIAAKHYTVLLSVRSDTAQVAIMRIFFSGMDIDSALFGN